MDQRSLIEIHSTLSEAGWNIHVEMTGRSSKDRVIGYLLSHPKFANENLEITLTYPIKIEPGQYELITRKESIIVSSISYTTESEAQYALVDACEKLIAENQPNVT